MDFFSTTLPDNIPYLYLAQDDLFRLGNAGSAKLDHVRDADVDTFEQNGVPMLVANGRGDRAAEGRMVVEGFKRDADAGRISAS